MEKSNHKIISFKTYSVILMVLLIFTAISVFVTKIDLGQLSTAVALLLASIKTLLVLAFFMHLIYDSKFYTYMIGLVVLVFTAVLIITFFDYGF